MKADQHESAYHWPSSANIAGTQHDHHGDVPMSRLDFSAGTFNHALRDVANEELEIVRDRYNKHRDPVRCAVGISLVLRALAGDFFGERLIARFRGVGWLSFLLRTSDDTLLRSDFVETMSAALYGDPVDVALPNDCSFWFDAATSWIDHQCNQRTAVACEVRLESNA